MTINEFLHQIDSVIYDKRDQVESWLKEHLSKVRIPLYTSVDLRVSEHKIVPVDTNIFPAGFNNLSPVFRRRASELFRGYFKKEYPNIKKILIIPESHTRNLFYWENVYTLKTILEDADFEVKIGFIGEELRKEETLLKTAGGKEIQVHRLKREGDTVFIPDFVPDLLLNNNDFSSGCPEVLQHTLQPMEPPIEVGWHSRKKSVHFEFYNKLALELARMLDIDPCTITIKTVPEKDVDFEDPEDLERIAQTVERLIFELQSDCAQIINSQKPFAFIKNNAGTYGIAVISVGSGDEVRALSAQDRKKMGFAKGEIPIKDVVIQEGIPTAVKYDRVGIVGEPVIYLVEDSVAGGFLRINRKKNEFDNLNTKGMEFVQLSSKDLEDHPSTAYNLISRVASIAAGYEIEKILSENGC